MRSTILALNYKTGMNYKKAWINSFSTSFFYCTKIKFHLWIFTSCQEDNVLHIIWLKILPVPTGNLWTVVYATVKIWLFIVKYYILDFHLMITSFKDFFCSSMRVEWGSGCTTVLVIKLVNLQTSLIYLLCCAKYTNPDTPGKILLK